MKREHKTTVRRATALAAMMIVLMLLVAGSSPVVAEGNGSEPPTQVIDTLQGDTLMGSPAGDPDDLDIFTTVLETLLLIP